MVADAGQLAQLIDFSVLHPGATTAELDAACEAARKYGFACVVVHSSYVNRARERLAGSLVKVCSTVGFPLGACTTTVKIFEAMEAMKNGAAELDIVLNICMVKNSNWAGAELDVKNVIALTPDKVHKIIIETGLLTNEEIDRAAELCVRVGAEYVKTSTGFGPRGASVEDISRIRGVVGKSCRIKASGGIRDLKTMLAMVEAGADRIGTSAGPLIMEEFRSGGR
jgi:deoxyribose-phosphate aldolase